jgi:hypothetical protein
MRMWWPAVQFWVGTGLDIARYLSQFPLILDYGRSPHAHVNQRLQIQLEILMMSGVPLETCWVFNERWNNKLYYMIASGWLFLLNHTMMHGSMNIKYKKDWIYLNSKRSYWIFLDLCWRSRTLVRKLLDVPNLTKTQHSSSSKKLNLPTKKTTFGSLFLVYYWNQKTPLQILS